MLGNISSLQEEIADGLADLKETGDYIGFVKHVRGGLAESYYKVRAKYNLAEIGGDVVVQFYHWFKLYFSLFQTCYHKLPYPKTKENKPGMKLNHNSNSNVVENLDLQP